MEHRIIQWFVRALALAIVALPSVTQAQVPDTILYGVAPRWWMEMLKPTIAEVVARYQHPSWPAAAAMTRNHWGKGEVSYIGFMPSDALAEKIVAAEVTRAGVESSVAGVQFPLIVRGGTLKNGHTVRHVLNYSAVPQHMAAPAAGIKLLHGRKVQRGGSIDLAAWDVAIIEEDGRSD